MFIPGEKTRKVKLSLERQRNRLARDGIPLFECNKKLSAFADLLDLSKLIVVDSSYHRTCGPKT